MIFKKRNRRIEEIKYESDNFFVEYDGRIIEIMIIPRKKLMEIDGEEKLVHVLNVEDIKGQIEIIEDAMLLENNDILSEAFELEGTHHHLKVDYHSLTMLGDEFDKRVKKLKRQLKRNINKPSS